MKVELTDSYLKVGGNFCDSVTIKQLSENAFQLVMFGNKKYEKTVKRRNRFNELINHVVNHRKTITRRSIEFTGKKPQRVKNPMLVDMYKKQGLGYFHVINKANNYINYYPMRK